MVAPVFHPLTAVRRAVDIAALAAWVQSSLAGGASADHVTDAGMRAGARVIVSPAGRQPLVLALAELRAKGYRRVRLVLPAPGDAAGLPGPPALNQRAISEGALLLIMPPGPVPEIAVALVPSDDGEWHAYEIPLPASVVAGWPSLRAARGEFLAGVAGHSDALTALDVAGNARGLREVVLGEDEQPLPPLPPLFPDGARELLGRARLVALLAAAGTGDDGAAVSAAEASSRAAHLRALAAIARRAIAAAASAP